MYPLFLFVRVAKETLLVWGRWNNGKMIIELLDPVYMPEDKNVTARNLTDQVHALMKAKISQLDEEVAKGK